MKVGVFDSGIGGEAIADSLKMSFPLAQIQVISDRQNLPYGDKSHHQLRLLTDAAIQPLLGNDAIIIACNSATTAAIEWLREKYPRQKFIGIEPMIKPAAKLSKNQIIGVCATPATLASLSYQRLVLRYGADLTIIEPDCSSWAQMIENHAINEHQIRQTIDEMTKRGADVIVLGCTHYHWIKDFIIQQVGPNVAVIEPSTAIGRRLTSLLADAPD